MIPILYILDLQGSSIEIEHLTIPAHEKVFIDSIIRNTSNAAVSNVNDSDDDSDPEDDSPDNESGDDVDFESDASSENHSDDSEHAREHIQEFDHLEISCAKEFLDHDQDTMETTQIGPVDMEISSSESIGTIECNVPVIMPENADLVEGSNPLIRLLPAGYENERAEGVQDQLSLVNETKCMCSIERIRELFSFCKDIDCRMPLVEVKETFVGSVLEIRWKCLAGHVGEWQSSKRVGSLYVNNIQTAAALLFTGNNFTKLSLFSKCLSLAFFSPQAFYQYQRKYLVPSVHLWWNDMQERMFSAIATKPVVVAGDGQMDSPGFSAKNCTCTLMHADLDYVLHVELVDVRHSQLKSSVMEKVGCERALDSLMNKLVVEELVTDASSQLIKMLGEY